jgi:Dictyostelium (slime mold) repeat
MPTPRTWLRLLPFAALAVVMASGSAAAALGDACFSNANCADGDLCNGAERCAGGICVAAPPLVCDDADPCTRDFCDPAAGCVHAEDQCASDCTGAPDGTRCADGTICTRGDACAGDVCVPGPAVACDDGDACSEEHCDPVYGCVFHEEAVGLPCLPTCEGAVADYTPCPGDDNVCTLDACLPSVDLIGNPHMCIIGLRGLERQCDDGDVCNGYEFCSQRLGCQSGPPLVCDDGDLCNGVESCDATLGCQPGTPAADGTGCSDGRQCTVGDACAAGGCVGAALTPADCTDGDGATDDACVEGFGCVHCRPEPAARVDVRAGAAGRAKLAARGTLDAGALATFVPASQSFTAVVDAAGVELLRAVVPAGGFTPSAGGNRLAFRDPDGALRMLALQRRAGGTRWKLRAEGLTAATTPAAVTVRLFAGDACAVSAASCTTHALHGVCR